MLVKGIFKASSLSLDFCALCGRAFFTVILLGAENRLSDKPAFGEPLKQFYVIIGHSKFMGLLSLYFFKTLQSKAFIVEIHVNVGIEEIC